MEKFKKIFDGTDHGLASLKSSINTNTYYAHGITMSILVSLFLSMQIYNLVFPNVEIKQYSAPLVSKYKVGTVVNINKIDTSKPKTIATASKSVRKPKSKVKSTKSSSKMISKIKKVSSSKSVSAANLIAIIDERKLSQEDIKIIFGNEQLDFPYSDESLENNLDINLDKGLDGGEETYNNNGQDVNSNQKSYSGANSNSAPDFKNEFLVEEAPFVDLHKLMKLIEYPELAKNANLEAEVIISVLLDETGRVIEHKIEYISNQLFEKEAIRAVKAMNYKPAYDNGKAVKCWLSIPITFKLR